MTATTERIAKASRTGAPRVLVFGIEGHLYTGAGLIQRQLNQRLAESLGAEWEIELRNGSSSLTSRLFARSGMQDASVWMCSPMPLVRPSGAYIQMVYDLRWRQTRSRWGELYRRIDLDRVLRNADHIVTISKIVRRQLLEYAPQHGANISVTPLGPGQMEGYPASAPENTRTIVLIGRAPHKRNEEVAALLASSTLVREHYEVLAISVSDVAASILQQGGVRTTICDDVERDEFGALLDRASVYVGLSTDEGFGLPYVEAAYCGCDVIAADVPVAREALGLDALFVRPVPPTLAQLEDALESWDADRVGRLTDAARARSWTATADHVATVIGETTGRTSAES